MTTFIALGSNIESRFENMKTALVKMTEKGLSVQGVSPVYQTPAALLFETVQEGWNKPYLNCIAKIETTKTAFEVLHLLKSIEVEMGRGEHEKWSPRVIDLDIIEHNQEKIDTPELTIPHRLYQERSFVLDPLSFFKNISSDILYTPSHQPMIMGIMNITPDSFSDGGCFEQKEAFEKNFNEWVNARIEFIDIGAESTRPKAIPLEADEELARLKEVFSFTKNLKKEAFSPSLSIDTYHFETAEKALASGFDVLNDINGFSCPKMLDLLAEHKEKRAVFMHNLDMTSLPLEKTLSTIEQWLEEKIELFLKKGIDLNHLYFDCGIGFKKTKNQSLLLLQNLERFHRFGVKLLIGHSRKSFMEVFNHTPAIQRDVETLSLSLGLGHKVDVLRVHTPIEHKRALLAKAHLNNQFY